MQKLTPWSFLILQNLWGTARFYGQISKSGFLPVIHFESRGTVWFFSTCWSKFRAHGTKSRQKTGEMTLFCLPDSSNPARAALKVEQNPPKLKKCSTRLPSPKQCGLRLRENLRNQRFDRNRSQVQWLNRWCAALHLARSLPITDKMVKNGCLSVKIQVFRTLFYGQITGKCLFVRKSGWNSGWNWLSSVPFLKR